jgi:long-chain fatty acid transport protein
MRSKGHPRIPTAACSCKVVAATVATFLSSPAHASNPLEYPDNGSASFSRGGAWLAVGNEPIAAHYNPAGLALQPTAVGIDVNMAFPHTCFDRRGPGNAVVGPDDSARQGDGSLFYSYRPVCSEKAGFPNTIPSIALSWRATRRIGLGMALVPPATYGTAENQFPIVAEGTDNVSGAPRLLPAPYRYMQVAQESTILFPTASIGYELVANLRVGLGFVSGIGVINTSTVGVSNLKGIDDNGDHMVDDSLTRLRTRDLFVPGAVLSVLWSPLPVLDVAAWGRFMDSIRTDTGDVDVSLPAFNGDGEVNPPCAGVAGCTANQSVVSHFPGALTRFEYPIPPEVRIGVRYHKTRTRALAAGDVPASSRDPLHDDVFDVELDGSYAWNSVADTIEVRFPERNGSGVVLVPPTNYPLPPNADRPTGYRDSIGVRFGGQWNAVRDLLGVRGGGWLESRSQDPAFLTVAPVGAFRWGFGAGVVVRTGVFDVSVGYQRHLSAGLDNGGDGRLRAPAATNGDTVTPFDLNREPPAVGAGDRTQFRTTHAVNGGSVSFDAHVFTLGGLARF